MEILIGKIIHYYRAIGVASVELSGPIEIGDTIHIKGHTTDFEQKVESMEIKHQKVDRADRGQVIGLKVNDYVRENDLVYRMEP